MAIESLESRTLLASLVGSSERDSLANFQEVLTLPPTRRLSHQDQFLTSPRAGNPLTIALDFLHARSAELGLTLDDLRDYRITDQYTSRHNGVTHIYLRQQVNGFDIWNADINVNISSRGEVISVGSSFVPNVRRYRQPTVPTPKLTAIQAVDAAASHLGLPSESGILLQEAQNASRASVIINRQVSPTDIPTQLRYNVNPEGGVELSWNLEIDRRNHAHYVMAAVSATDGRLLHAVDRVWNARYNVFPIPIESPDHGQRSIVVDVHDLEASPFGWHDTDGRNGAEFTDTRGNNTFAQEDRDFTLDQNGARPDGTATLVFDFPLDLTQEPNQYIDAAVTNMFYWINVLHDVHYQYGFDELAGNFQENNYQKGGLGRDPVLAQVQAGADIGMTNDAFYTPTPDGESPSIAMFVFDLTTPMRDSAFDAGIIAHEFGHGVSTRATGGGSNVDSLDALQSGGLGEGWSDFYALMFMQNATDGQFDAYPSGTYVLDQPVTGDGIRRFPFSFDMSINPLTFGDFNGGFPNNEVHNSGEIWASALWDLNWLLINGDGQNIPAKGYDPDLYNGTGGNNLLMQLVMDGIKLQPTQPTYLDARDAILAADEILTGGENNLAIWTAFARRGMGFSASAGLDANSEVVVEAFDLPPPPIIVGSIAGIKFSDVNGNGTQDEGEPPLAGVPIHLDLDGDGKIGFNEPTVLTDANGFYHFGPLNPATYNVREVVPPGFEQIVPILAHVIELENAQDLTTVHFANRPAYDFGDAPASFGTADPQGARHGMVLTLHLGTALDFEPVAMPDAQARGDDGENLDDEDGVVFSTMMPGSRASVDVTVEHGPGLAGLLQGWIDFDGDGRWGTAGEQIIRDQAVQAGLNRLSFPVPAWAVTRPVFARFRYGYERGLGPNGHAIAGEVEDYLVPIGSVISTEPIDAIHDTFTVEGGPTVRALPVLDNDRGPGLSIERVGIPNQGGRAVIADDQLSIQYTPPAGFSGTETFTYTVRGANGNRDDARVTVNVLAVETGNPLATFRLQATQNGTPITQVAAGESFQLEGHVRDLRPQTAASGVFGAYVDVNYPAGRIAFSGEIDHGSEFVNAASGTTSTAGIIDEVGGVAGLSPTGSREVRLFSILVTANGTGPLQISATSANVVPAHAWLLFGEPQPIPPAQIRFTGTTLEVVGAPIPVLTNPVNRLDVNGDGFITSIDALLIINDLNRNSAARQRTRSLAAATITGFLDVNGDSHVAAIDALLVINHLNRESQRRFEAVAARPLLPSGPATSSAPPRVANAASLDNPVLEEIVASIVEDVHQRRAQ